MSAGILCSMCFFAGALFGMFIVALIVVSGDDEGKR